MKLSNILLSSALLISLNSLAADYEYEIVPKIGQNFFDDDSGLDDETSYGVDLNYYLNSQTGLQIGYERISKSKYRWYYPNETDIDRFYLNAVYEPTQYNSLTPYFLAGGGYEKLSKEIGNQKSQGFLDAGLGVKYSLNPVFDLIAEAKYIKKLDTMDSDVVTNLGMGYKFGTPISSMRQLAQNTANREEFTPKPLPLPDSELQSVNAQMTQEELPMPESKEKDIFKEHKEMKQPALSSKNIPPSPKQNFANEGEYFIQVGAYALKKPEQRYLNDIIQKGYNVTLHDANVKGRKVTKILIGPYSSYEEAKKILPDIKSCITNSAFIYKM